MLRWSIEKFSMVAFRLQSGEDLNEKLETMVKEMGCGFAYLFGVQAQFDSVTLGFWDPERAAYDFEDLRLGPCRTDPYSRLEPTSLSGNVAWVGDKPFAHIHGGFASGFPSDWGEIVGGGHISKAIVGRTWEGVLLVTDDIRISREMDPDPKCGVRIWKLPEIKK